MESPQLPIQKWGIQRRQFVIGASVILGVIVLSLAISVNTMIIMPGKSHIGPIPALNEAQKAMADRMRGDVEEIAKFPGQRHLSKGLSKKKVRELMQQRLEGVGYRVQPHAFPVSLAEGRNYEAVIDGTAPELPHIVVGAHYDTLDSTPGADDNASGVAALLEIACQMQGKKFERSIHFVAFDTEEAPFFGTQKMGSLLYASALKEIGIPIEAMLSLESMGYYSEEPNSQQFPLEMLGKFYPHTGNFIGFVGNTDSSDLVKQCVKLFRQTTRFPSEGIAAPASVPGVGWSDHWSFWQIGVPAIMVTDTAPFRNPNYHKAEDLPETLDYEAMALVVEGLIKVIGNLAHAESSTAGGTDSPAPAAAKAP